MNEDKLNMILKNGYKFDPNNIEEYEEVVKYQDENFDTLGLENMLVLFEPSAYRKACLDKATDEQKELYYKLCDEM